MIQPFRKLANVGSHCRTLGGWHECSPFEPTIRGTQARPQNPSNRAVQQAANRRHGARAQNGTPRWTVPVQWVCRLQSHSRCTRPQRAHRQRPKPIVQMRSCTRARWTWTCGLGPEIARNCSSPLPVFKSFVAGNRSSVWAPAR